jgi:transposase
MSEKLSMRKIKDILRLRSELSLSHRDIASSIKASSSTVGECLRRTKEAGLSWPLPEHLDDEQLEQMLYSPIRNQTSQISHDFDWKQIHSELRRKGVTRYLLWYDYKQEHPEGLSYSRFCKRYRKWLKTIDACMRQTYKFGEKMFVDYTGVTISVMENGNLITAQIFVACLGGSNYTFVEATKTQSLPDWIDSHTRAFSYFGGAPEIVVPDNLKSGVKHPHLYEPDLNPTYDDMAEHYGVAVMPARVATPRDKAKVEQAVQHVERQILAKLRDRQFFSIYELNQAIKPLLEEINAKPFQKLPGSRKSRFEIEKESLRPLPSTPYIFAEWKKARLGADYHIALDKHYYSAPHILIDKKLDVRYSSKTVEIFCQGKRVASHRRSYQKGGYTTLPEHMPESHRQHAAWTPQRIINWAKKNGEYTSRLAEKIIESRRHPQQGFRSCLGIIRLGKSYGDRLEKACERAFFFGAYSYKSVESILKNNLDNQPLPSKNIHPQATEQRHEHVRGSDYFK